MEPEAVPLSPAPLPGCIRCGDFLNLERALPAGSVSGTGVTDWIRRAGLFLQVIYLEHRHEHDRIPFAEPESDPFPTKEAPTAPELTAQPSKPIEKSEASPPPCDSCDSCGCSWEAHQGHTFVKGLPARPPTHCSNCIRCRGYVRYSSG